VDAERDTFVGLEEDGAGVLALREGYPTQFRIYATYKDPLDNSGIYNAGQGWRLMINGIDRGPIPWPIGDQSNGC